MSDHTLRCECCHGRCSCGGKRLVHISDQAAHTEAGEGLSEAEKERVEAVVIQVRNANMLYPEDPVIEVMEQILRDRARRADEEDYDRMHDRWSDERQRAERLKRRMVRAEAERDALKAAIKAVCHEHRLVFGAEARALLRDLRAALRGER